MQEEKMDATFYESANGFNHFSSPTNTTPLKLYKWLPLHSYTGLFGCCRHGDDPPSVLVLSACPSEHMSTSAVHTQMLHR